MGFMQHMFNSFQLGMMPVHGLIASLWKMKNRIFSMSKVVSLIRAERLFHGILRIREWNRSSRPIRLQKIQARLKKGVFTDRFEKELATFWHEKEKAIRQIVQQAEDLGRSLQKQPLEFVLCHADIHTANILITPGQKMCVLDWDETIFAPKERDLMFVLGIPEQERLFFQGYGDVNINWPVIAYYRYEWVVQEVADYGERVFLMDDLGETTKEDAVERFIKLFLPGDVVEAVCK
jgi:hypothetical protein